MNNAQLLSKSQHHYTPANLIAAARLLMGSIDVDPASSIEANKTVKAQKIFTYQEDGLTKNWDINGQPSNVWLNPPGGKLKNKSLTGLFWKKLTEQYHRGKVKEALFLCFSVEALQVTQSDDYGELSVCDFPILFFKKRLAFTCGDPNSPSFGKSVSSNTHASCLVWLPPRFEASLDIFSFVEAFQHLGQIMEPF